MTSSVSLESLLGQLIAGIHNGNLLSPRLYPVLAEVEQQTLSWLCQLFEQQYGHFVPGGSYGNLEALWQAKQNNRDNRRTVYASKAAHYSIAKACRILELSLVYIETDGNEQLDSDALRLNCEKEAPLAIIATAGTPSTGSFDPLSDCIKVAKQFESWSHIDAAWGGAFKVLPEYDLLFDGLKEADSLSFDPHKAWAQPKPCSVILYQKPLEPFLSADSDYLEQNPNCNLPGSYGGESFLPLWLSLLISGTDHLKQNLYANLEQAKRFKSLLMQHSSWQVYDSPSAIVCFDADGLDLAELIEQSIISQSKRAGKKVYRSVFVNNKVEAQAIIAALQHYF